MRESVDYSEYGIKLRTKGVILTAGIIEIVLGVIFLCFAGFVVFLGIGFMFMGQAWGQSIMDALGFYGVFGAFVMALLVIYCIVAFLICLIVGVLMTVSGVKTAHACKNPMALISARKTILGYAIFYCVLIVILACLIPFGSVALSLIILIVMEALLLTITILKFVGASQLPKELLTVDPHFAPILQQPMATQYRVSMAQNKGLTNDMPAKSTTSSSTTKKAGIKSSTTKKSISKKSNVKKTSSTIKTTDIGKKSPSTKKSNTTKKTSSATKK